MARVINSSSLFFCYNISMAKVINTNNNQQDNNNKKREDKIIIFTIFGSVILTVFIIMMIIFVPKWLKSGPTSNNTSNSGYVVNEDTKIIHDNLKTYVDLEIEDLGMGFKKVEKFTSFKFNDHHLTLTYITSDNPGYIDITMPEQNDISSALTSFKDEPPLLGAYDITISNETYGEDAVVHLNDKDINVKTSVKDTHKYVSLMTFKDESTISVISHEEYQDSGIYNHIDITPNSDKVFFDLAYYLIH